MRMSNFTSIRKLFINFNHAVHLVAFGEAHSNVSDARRTCFTTFALLCVFCRCVSFVNTIFKFFIFIIVFHSTHSPPSCGLMHSWILTETVSLIWKIAFCYGLRSAILAYCSVWIWTPFVGALAIFLRPIKVIIWELVDSENLPTLQKNYSIFLTNLVFSIEFSQLPCQLTHTPTSLDEYTWFTRCHIMNRPNEISNKGEFSRNCDVKWWIKVKKEIILILQLLFCPPNPTKHFLKLRSTVWESKVSDFIVIRLCGRPNVA